jgi:hypothetical protein
MFPEDRVLVGVMKARRDYNIARHDRWYRIPQSRMPGGLTIEYMAFFLSGSTFRSQSGGIHYYATFEGLELHYRRDLLPEQPDHPRANDVYYKVQLGELLPKDPPILNTTNRRFAFIFTTWDRFFYAKTIPDLYSKDDYFVDRIYHALTSRGVAAERTWEALTREPPRLRVLCQRGDLFASPSHSDGSFYLDSSKSEDAVLESIREAISKQGGPVMINIPYD